MELLVISKIVGTDIITREVTRYNIELNLPGNDSPSHFLLISMLSNFLAPLTKKWGLFLHVFNLGLRCNLLWPINYSRTDSMQF